jgi:nucleoside-diphosphate-sugar epimerase
VIGARGLREGAPLAGRPDAWLNLIHRDDAADLLRHCLVPLAGGRIEVGSDGRPLRRGEYYRELAARLAASAPRFAPAAADTSPGKRVDPRSTWQRRDWRPRYPDCMLGVAQALRAEQAN